jgi:hypothetical protein
VRLLILLVVLALPASARQVPFYLRAVNTQRDVAGINENFRTLADGLLPLDGGSTVSCTGSQVILAPIYANGVLQSGTCAANGSGGTTVTTASPISGDGSTGNPVSLTGAVPTSFLNLSTITTALAAKADSSALAAKADDSAVVHLAGAETITGAKDLRTLSSSMTVKGNAFSVGGSSFTVTGGSATAAYQMTAGSFQANNITGSAQCVHADTNGLLTGTGTDCGSGSGGSGTNPNRQTRTVLTATGAGTYTVPDGVTHIFVRMIAGGGGGAGSHTSAANGSAGANSAFGAWTTVAGSGGQTSSSVGGAGGSGGQGSAFRIAGSSATTSAAMETGGGGTALGGGGGGTYNGSQGNGYSGAPHSGGGGGGCFWNGGSPSYGSGGGGGEYAEFIITSPTATYNYVIGAGGAGGNGACHGGDGAAGVIIIDEFYNSYPVAGSVGFRQKNFLGQANGSQKTFTLPESASSSPTVVLDGLLQSGTSDYTWDGAATITMTTAPASNSSSFFVLYTVNTSTLAAAMLTTSSDTVSGAKTFTSTVTVLGSANFEVMVASVNFTASVATFTLISDGSLSVLASSTVFHVHCGVRAVTGSSYPVLVFGNGTTLDFAQHYQEGGQMGQTTGSGFGGASAGVNLYYSWHLKGDLTSQAAGNRVDADITFESEIGSTNTLRGRLDSVGDDSPTVYGLRTIGHTAYKRDGATISSLAFAGCAAALGTSCSANKTYTGHCELYRGPTYQ